jgi:hypothetical protein
MVSTSSCAADPVPSPSKSRPGTRSSLSAGSSPARKQTPHQAVRDAVTDYLAPAWWPSRPPPTAAAFPHPGGACFQTPWSLHLHIRSSRANTRELFFPRLGPAAPSQPPQQRHLQRQRRTAVRIGLQPRLLRGQSSAEESCGELVTPLDLVATADNILSTPCTACSLYSKQSRL